MVMSHHGVNTYMTAVDSYANLPIRPSMTTASAEQSMLHRYHTGYEEEWKPKPKKNNLAISALVLLSFLFFLNILQNCVEDHIKKQQHHHGHRHPYYYQNYTYLNQYQYPWPVWQVSARTDLKPQQKPLRVEEAAYDEPQDYVEDDSVSEEETKEEESTGEAPIERFLPDLLRTRVNSKHQTVTTGSGEGGVLMEKLAPIIDRNKKNPNN